MDSTRAGRITGGLEHRQSRVEWLTAMEQLALPICSKCRVAYLAGEYHNCSEPARAGKPLSPTSVKLGSAFSRGRLHFIADACVQSIRVDAHCWVVGLAWGVPVGGLGAVVAARRRLVTWRPVDAVGGQRAEG